MKNCATCGLSCSSAEFSGSKRAADGLQSTCKKCCKEYYSKNAVALSETHKKWYIKNKAKVAEYGRRWRTENRGRVAASARRRNAENPERFASYHRKRKYGVTVEEWDKMMLAQGGACAICGNEGKLGVDHNHQTGKVRALLCNQCNPAIGLLRDDPRIVRLAAEYLEKHI